MPRSTLAVITPVSGDRPSHPIVIPPDGIAPGVPTHPIHLPGAPDNTLPGDQPGIDNSLPGDQPHPDHDLPRPWPPHPVDPGFGVGGGPRPSHPIWLPPLRPSHPIVYPPGIDNSLPATPGLPPLVDNTLPPVVLPELPNVPAAFIIPLPQDKMAPPPGVPAGYYPVLIYKPGSVPFVGWIAPAAMPK